MEIIIASLFSGLLGAIASALLFIRYEKKKYRLDTAKKLFGNRHNITGFEFSQAINEVYFVFNHNPKVLHRIENLFNITSTENIKSEQINDAVVSLLKSICDDIGVNYKTLNESFMLKVFNNK
ncbi:DUF6680 family protein [uncultured Shewanella sp.]|uniref:DUF6680 family protein n=1 Tax=uncultured Shewanella sp. TaxID=173975 RepID=UPI002612DB4C|nr:DUF6680 family protein [uncultured Shewanella sp.]